MRMRARANEPPISGSTSEGPPAAVSFDDFYHAHYHELTTQLCAYVGDLQQAQDLAQEAFCRAFSRWEKLTRYDDPVAWVRKVAWNLARSRWRRVRTAQRYLLRQRPSDQHLAGPSPDRIAIDTALAQLPPQSAACRHPPLPRRHAGLGHRHTRRGARRNGQVLAAPRTERAGRATPGKSRGGASCLTSTRCWQSDSPDTATT